MRISKLFILTTICFCIPIWIMGQEPSVSISDLIGKVANGDADAQYRLARMYERGEGVSRDNTEALEWYRKAADQGHAEAQFTLGVMYKRGQGVPQDNTEALKWYHKAADQGEVRSQGMLGMMYYNGQGVSQDYIQAHMWFNLIASTRKGDLREIGVVLRDSVTKKMTSEQIAEAQRLAKEWMEQHKK